jgi:chorismate mutase
MTEFTHIAGPCSAESKEQLMKVALGLSKQNIKIDYFRAGVWKPRTNPGAFEGHGEDALKWLQDVKEKFGFKICCEVAEPAHIKLAIGHGVDMLWIGARTSGNPFSMQAIAEELEGTDIPIYVKNPMNPDLSLWIGAIERLQAKGVKNIGAIHRGFSTFEKTKYRNMPGWHVPVAFKRKMPNIPMLIDPSHITGNPMLIQHVTQRGINFGADGMMVEVHSNPEDAITDAEQQITPTQYRFLVDGLKFGKHEVEDDGLAPYRRKVDELDSLLISTLSERMQVAKQIGTYKSDNNILPLQMNRWNQILTSRIAQGKEHGLTEELVESMYESIHKASLKIQSE